MVPKSDILGNICYYLLLYFIILDSEDPKGKNKTLKTEVRG